MVLTLVRLRGVRVHAEQHTLVFAPHAGPDGGIAPFPRDPQLTRVVTGLRAKNSSGSGLSARRSGATGPKATKKAIASPLPPHRAADE
jgi:hypothetical protein